ncbi:hypothetical protein J1N09_04160 [Aureitalea sp. L0-47]|uniref:hypothetical protein n=1 Tax=Aureitalea sp. L0-47 TaxID=2816962 RepID=UPI0022380753|nr:hypothetical protein [Aureitalea sp. L0-47]MCW5519018.1 hypothetical protein [Aureitalea sp. L0-47]
MKKFTLLLLVLTIPLFGCPKKPFEGEMTKKINSLEIPGASIDFKNLMIEIAMEVDACDAARENCSNLPDPWKEGKMLTLQKQIEYVKDHPESKEIQLKMAMFERAMLDGEGGKILTSGNTFTVFAYHAGYGFENIKKRMNKYIGLLSEENE